MSRSGFVSCLSALFFFVSGNAQNGTLAALPHELTVHSGSDFIVSIEVNAGNEPVAASDLYMVFDTTYLEVVDFISTDSPLNLNPIEPRFDNEKGTIIYSAFKLGESLPTGLFSLTGVRLRCKRATEETTIEIPVEGRYKTVLAYAGKNVLRAVRDIKVKILPEKDIVEEDIEGLKPELNVSCSSESGICRIGFAVAKSGFAQLELHDASGETTAELFVNIAHPESDYQFSLDVDFLPKGRGVLELILDDVVISKTIEN